MGTVAHRTLQLISKGRGAPWTPKNVPARREQFRRALQRLGVPDSEMKEATTRVEQAVARTLADPKGAWLLEGHQDAESEMALTAVLDGETVHVQIDRTFVDGGVRWIVDYKTGSHEGAELEGFLDSEQERYRAQLERYARIMREYDPEHPIKLALYFPLLQAIREWDPPESSAPPA